MPANKDLPAITTCGFYVSNYVWDDFDPNKNYIGAAIMAVRDGDNWYVDGRKEPYQVDARNGWYGQARIRPGYIIMREADYLQGRYRDADVNPECNGNPVDCPTFHSGKYFIFLFKNHKDQILMHYFKRSFKTFFGENQSITYEKMKYRLLDGDSHIKVKHTFI